MAGYYTEAEFLNVNLSPPKGHIWMWFDYQVGRVGYAKLSHTSSNNLPLKDAIRSLSKFLLDLDTPKNVSYKTISPPNKQKWVIETIKPYPSYNYTLFKITPDISSEAVMSKDSGNLGGSGFNFRASGDAIVVATGSNSDKAEDQIPQGYFPDDSDYPKEQYFRGYNGANFYTSYQVYSNIGGSITDTDNNFTNGVTEINGAFATNKDVKATPNIEPWFIDGEAQVVSFTQQSITDLTPSQRTELLELAGLYLASSSGNATDTVEELCNGNFTDKKLIIGILSNSPLLSLEQNILKIKSGTPGETLNTIEPLRTKGSSNTWSSQSIIKAGATTIPNISGKYRISIANILSESGVVSRQKALAIIDNNSIKGIEYCPGSSEDLAIGARFQFTSVGTSQTSINQNRQGIHIGTVSNDSQNQNFQFGSYNLANSFPIKTTTLSDNLVVGNALKSSTSIQNLALTAFYTDVYPSFGGIGTNIINIGLINGYLDSKNQFVKAAKPGTYGFKLTGRSVNHSFQIIMSSNPYFANEIIGTSVESITLISGEPYNLEITSTP